MDELTTGLVWGHGTRDRIGSTVCGWTITKSLGGGPVAESWLACRSGEPSSVVRVLRTPFARDERMRAEWLGANWAANRFHHARVPQIIADGTDGRGAPVVVREWAEGRPLEQVIRNGTLDLMLALRLAEQLLDALEMAHAHGIIHGALSPSNVIVTARGSARLVDFATTPGLLGPTGGALSRVRMSSFTAPEHRVTTLDAPTQQSDVWGVGACLHFGLSGTPPVAGRPLLQTDPTIREDVIAVVDRALAADPPERYESAYAMLGDIRRLTVGRRPRLRSTTALLPSQTSTEAQSRPTSSPTMRGLRGEPRTELDLAKPAGAKTAARSPVRSSEWRGNLLLVFAIALLAAVAAFALVRERLADGPDPALRATSPPSPGG